MIANLNEDPSGSECQLDSTIQGPSRGPEKGRRKTNRGRKSRRVEDRKNIK